MSGTYRAYPNLRTLGPGASGFDVKRAQYFLAGAGFFTGEADGRYGPLTTLAVKAYQKKRGLIQDGIIGPRTFAMMLNDGMDAVVPLSGQEGTSGDWPPAPDYLTALGTKEREKWFGKYTYRSDPHAADKDAVVITDNWEDKNIVKVVVPALSHLRGDKPIRLHRLVVDDFQAFFKAVEDAGLHELIQSFDGSFFPRYQRGSRSVLSAHAWGTAIDLNADTNGLAVYPPEVGSDGSLRELVPLANKHRLFWGGHFSRRRDGMHFEHVGF